ncbi:group II intron reverse transcriptase/maturase [Streptomyces shenzhenensis]|uniref:group II intron reverse transcriptase/maturase n=1 Tax=Streptomyces shenzhenensis TaxID=943815 RepID=UPI001C690215|nr:group II intron reverse transcriptase/maturase [Streptomyces shenzhenensis]
MAKGASKSAAVELEGQEVSLVNTDELEYAFMKAERRVLEIQTKLHRWAGDDPHRRFDDLFNLVADPAFLLVAWDRVKRNKGARTAGVEGRTARSIALTTGVENFLDRLRVSLKDRSFRPLPVRERMIPKTGGKLRRLGINTIADRVVQASLKLVLEPIFETDFLPCSYGFRPNRRAHDAVAEVRFLTSKSYEWIVEGDIKACFDEISHTTLLDRVRARIADKRVLGLAKAFLKAGILGEDRVLRENNSGTPQGSILSPLLSNVALSVLDEYVAQEPGGPTTKPYQGARRKVLGLPNYRLVRYADDWCLMVSGTRADAEELREQAAVVLSTMGLRLSPEKTLITHIDEGLDFLGWRIQRHPKRGTERHYVYTYPSRKAVKAVTGKVKTVCRGMDTGQPLDALLIQLNWILRGWCAYFRPGVSSLTFKYLSSYAWARVMKWLFRKHRRITVKDLRRRFCGGGWWPGTKDRMLFNPAKVSTTRYRYRGTVIPTPWPTMG